MTISSLLILLLLALGLYSFGMSRIANQLSPRRQRWHLVWFTLGLLAALATFIPSPDLLGPDHRFTVSMAQMLIAIDLAPLLLLLGIPKAALQPLLRWDGLGRRLSRTILIELLSAAILLGWFVPILFEAASRDLTIWLLKQALLMVSGLLLWWPVAAPLPAWRPSYLMQIFYFFIMRIPMTLLGFLMTFSTELIYTARSFALEICAPSSLPDQVVGGLVMWAGGGVILFAAFSVLFFRWFRGTDFPNPGELNHRIIEGE